MDYKMDYNSFWRNFDNRVTTVLKFKTPWNAIIEFKEFPDVYVDAHIFEDKWMLNLTVLEKPRLVPHFSDGKLYTKYEEGNRTCISVNSLLTDLRKIEASNMLQYFIEDLCLNLYKDYESFINEKFLDIAPQTAKLPTTISITEIVNKLELNTEQRMLI